MKVGLSLSMQAVNPRGSVLDLTSIAWTGLWYDYSGSSPWAGTASTGSSASHELDGPPSTVDAPAAGATLNSHATADFDGLDDALVATGTLGTYITTTVAYLIAVFKADTAAADAGAGSRYLNPQFFADGNGIFGVGFSSSGVHAYGLDTGVSNQEMVIACATGGWHIVEARLRSGTLDLRLDGGTRSTKAMGGGAFFNSLGLMCNVGIRSDGSSNRYDGKIALLGVRSAATDDATADLIYTSVKARYGL